MCTVHSFPHNIDHCLTWARSEFEGLLEKGPSEANAYLADPAKYTGAWVGCKGFRVVGFIVGFSVGVRV